MVSLSNALLGIFITLNNPIMVDSDDESDIDGDGLHQESSKSLPPLVLNSIWDCSSITLNNFADANGNMIKGWHCGYCPIPDLPG